MSEDRKYMQLALDASRRCIPSDTSYSVGAVVLTASGRVFVGYTHETGPANHAEEEAVAKALAAGEALSGATVYSTMEPCSSRKSKPLSCTQLIIDYRFRRVVYALNEPMNFTSCHGDRLLRDAGIEVDVLDEFAGQVKEVNSHIIK